MSNELERMLDAAAATDDCGVARHWANTVTLQMKMLAKERRPTEEIEAQNEWRETEA
jgi:hypothetical protein